MAEYETIKRVWSKHTINQHNRVGINDKTIDTVTVQFELKLRDKKGEKYKQK